MIWPATRAESPPTWTLEANDRQVIGWSRQRLPFEPRDEMLMYRDALRSALRGLTAHGSEALLAEYTSRDPTKVDLENLLLYNLGSASWRHLTLAGLLCERRVGDAQGHLVHYRMGEPVLAQTNGALLANVTVGEPTRPPATAAGWWAACRGGLQVFERDWPGEFTLDIELPSRLNIASVLKPMLDGLIAALQAHDGSNRKQARLALAPLGDPDRVWSQLTDVHQAVLGVQRILIPRAIGMMWSPGDDRCCGFAIKAAPGPGNRFTALVRARVSPPREN